MFLLVVGISAFVSVINGQCSWDPENVGVSFDLTPLQIVAGNQLKYYVVEDAKFKSSPTHNFHYYFNLCAPPLEVPDQACEGAQYYCTSWDPVKGNCTTAGKTLLTDKCFVLFTCPLFFHFSFHLIHPQNSVCLPIKNNSIRTRTRR